MLVHLVIGDTLVLLALQNEGKKWRKGIEGRRVRDGMEGRRVREGGKE